jgi:hypothetical protein
MYIICKNNSSGFFSDAIAFPFALSVLWGYFMTETAVCLFVFFIRLLTPKLFLLIRALFFLSIHDHSSFGFPPYLPQYPQLSEALGSSLFPAKQERMPAGNPLSS